MALQSFANKLGTILAPIPLTGLNSFGTGTGTTLNATGESVTAIGRIFLEAGSGSKTISSAGGKIHWRTTGTVTFADAGTNLRIGIQDVGATGLEDGTFDVQANLVGGTDTIGSNSFLSTAMESGSKTISHGDLIAVSFEMTARAGADSVIVASYSSTGQFPYNTADTGGGVAKESTSQRCVAITIEFDDGTVGWFPPFYAPAGATFHGTLVTAFGNGSTPDERALIFELPFPSSIVGVWCFLTSLADTDDLELILYSDPLGTPTVVEAITVDASYTANATQVGGVWPFTTSHQLAANTKYALAVRPTTANTIQTAEIAFGAANLMRPNPYGVNGYLGTRTDQTGAFSTTVTTLPMIGAVLSKFDDGLGLFTHPGMAGGMRG